jgi:hypothetical protein
VGRRSDRGSLEFHVETFRDVGAEAGRDDDAAAHFLRIARDVLEFRQGIQE